MEETTVIPTSALTLEELEQHNLNLECLLAALTLKFGRAGVLPVSEAEIDATRGHTFSLDMGLPDGSVCVKAIRVGAVEATPVSKPKTVPEIVFPMPAMAQ